MLTAVCMAVTIEMPLNIKNFDFMLANCDGIDQSGVTEKSVIVAVASG